MPNRLHLAVLLSLGLAISNIALAQSCDAYFSFDGNLSDLTGNGFDGQAIGSQGAQATAQFVAGHSGQALAFDGTYAVRAFLDLNEDLCPQVTIAAWIRVDDATVRGVQNILSTGSGSGPGIRRASTTLTLAGPANGLMQPNAIRSDAGWMFVAGVYDYQSSHYTLYWRDRSISGEIAANRRTPEEAFWIGAFNDGLSGAATGIVVDDVRIYGRALSAEEIGSLATGQSPGTLASASTSATGATCSMHSDCAAGTYCAFDNTCHPERHLPKQDLVLAPAQTGTLIFTDGVRTAEAPAAEAPAAEEPAAPSGSGPYAAGTPSYSALAGWTGGIQRTIDLGSEFLSSIVLRSVGDRICYVEANGQALDLCNGHTGTQTDIDVVVPGSVIGRIEVCGLGAVQGLRVWGDVVDPDGTTRYAFSADSDQFPACNRYESLGSAWTSSVLCPTDTVGSGIVVHASDPGTVANIVVGLQLICRRIAVN